MYMFAFRQPKRDVASRLFHGAGHRNLDPTFDLANVLRIGVQLGFIARTEVLLEKNELMSDRIQNAGILLSSSRSLLGTCSVAEKPLEGYTGVHFRGKRLGRGRP